MVIQNQSIQRKMKIIIEFTPRHQGKIITNSTSIFFYCTILFLYLQYYLKFFFWSGDGFIIIIWTFEYAIIPNPYPILIADHFIIIIATKILLYSILFILIVKCITLQLNSLWNFKYRTFQAKYTKMADMDENLMTFVNILGVIVFISIVAYHMITATPKDAEF